MKLTEQQFNRLCKFERHLLTASKANYVTAIYKATGDEITAIYNEIFSTTKRGTNCGKCVLDMCKRLAPLFYEYQETIKNTAADENTTDVEQEPTEEKKTPQKGKKQRKKKTKTNSSKTE